MEAFAARIVHVGEAGAGQQTKMVNQIAIAGVIQGVAEALRFAQAAGLDTLYDDRDQPAGSKFATADLIGIPYQIILGPRGLKDGQVELKHRKSGERETLPLGRAVARLKSLIEPERRDKV